MHSLVSLITINYCNKNESFKPEKKIEDQIDENNVEYVKLKNMFQQLYKSMLW